MNNINQFIAMQINTNGIGIKPNAMKVIEFTFHEEMSMLPSTVNYTKNALEHFKEGHGESETNLLMNQMIEAINVFDEIDKIKGRN